MAKDRGPDRSDYEVGWASACGLYRHLAGGGQLGVVRTDLLLELDETPHAYTTLEYARYYGVDIEITYTEPILPFTLSPFQRIRDSLDRAAARRAYERALAEAQRRSTPSWQGYPKSKVVITSHRMLCRVDGEWLSFWYSVIVQLAVDMPKWSFQLGFQSGAPLMLTGPDAPVTALAVAYLVRGEEGLRMHWFAPLADGSTMPPPL